MINKTLEECKNISFAEINYSNGLNERRNYIFRELKVFLNAKGDYNKYVELATLKNLDILSNIEFDKKQKETVEQFKKKVQTFADDFGYAFDFVLNKALSDDVFLCNFTKNPTRETFHQHYAFEYYKNTLFFFDNIYELNNHGPSARYVCNGKVITESEKTAGNVTKSIDGCFEYKFGGKTLTFYTTNKYTKDEGGSQDNQRNDVNDFLKQAQNNEYTDVVFGSITDGEYYLRQKKLSGIDETMSTLDYFEKLYEVENKVVVANSSTFIYKSLKVIKNWLKENFSESEELTNELSKIDALKDNAQSFEGVFKIEKKNKNIAIQTALDLGI